MVQIENRATAICPKEMHHICNFVRLCFNNNKNATLKKAQKNIINKKNIKNMFFLNFIKKHKKRFFTSTFLQRKYYARKIEGLRSSNLRNWWHSSLVRRRIQNNCWVALPTGSMMETHRNWPPSVNVYFLNVTSDLSPLLDEVQPLPLDVLSFTLTKRTSNANRARSTFIKHLGLIDVVGVLCPACWTCLRHLQCIGARGICSILLEGSERNSNTECPPASVHWIWSVSLQRSESCSKPLSRRGFWKVSAAN